MRSSLLAALLLLAACGGGGGDGGDDVPLATALTVTSPDLGLVSKAVGEAAGFTGDASCTFAAPVGAVALAYAVAGASDAAGVCARAQAGQRKAGSVLVAIAIGTARPGSAAAPVEPGAYAVSGDPSVTVDLQGAVSRFAFAQVFRFGGLEAACAASAVVAESGSVQVRTVEADRLRGTVDLTLADGGRVTGTWVAERCAAQVATAGLCSGSVADVLVAPACAP